MRVTIEHRDKTSGVLQNRKEYYIDCLVEFSEEERSIIHQRGLYKQGFIIRTSTPRPSTASFTSTIALQVLSPVAAIGGFIYGLVTNSSLGGWLALVGSGLFIYSLIRRRREDQRFANDEQMITYKKLLADPRFTINASSPFNAQVLDEELRANLAGMKYELTTSAELRTQQTFEL